MGFFRLYLALCVIGAHSVPFWPFTLFGGTAAVQVFYVLSGFYMAMVLNRRYVGEGSVPRFYASRALRLWPAYLVVTACVVALSYRWEAYGLESFVRQWLAAPFGLQVLSVFSNVFLLGQDLFCLLKIAPDGGVHYVASAPADAVEGYGLLLNVPAFTVALEFYFYLMAPFVLRDFKRCVWFLIAGLGWYAGIELLNIVRLDTAYNMWPSTWVFFALGGVVWWVGQNRAGISHMWMGVAGIAALCLLAVPLQGNGAVLLACAALVPVLFRLTKKWPLDRLCGDISYGVYIIHWGVIGLNARTLTRDDPYSGVKIALITFGCALFLYVAFEIPLTMLRNKWCRPKPIET